MSKEYVFEQTLSILGATAHPVAHETINPMIPSSPAIPARSLDLGLTIPTLEDLPTLAISSKDEEDGGDKGEFEILGVLGAGGMGVVELARQSVMQREVVIKRPHGHEASRHQINALVKEGILTGRLEHPNIIPVHFLGRTKQGLPALVMKRIVGTNWREMIHDEEHPFWNNVQGDRLDWHLRVLLQVSNAIDFAHSKGILHRDIKPENVMLGDFGEVYVLDWGIGLVLGDEKEAQPKQFAGTPSYMAPEMLGDRLTVRTDVYLLGATLHEVITKKFLHDGEDFSEVIFQAKHSRPYAYDADVPEELVKICHRATHRDPEQRYPSAAAFREAIEEHLRHRNALHLIQTASERLEKLREQVGEGKGVLSISERVSLNELATECRFALREALRIWPDASRAHAALRECTLLMAEMELELGNLPSAELLLAEVEELPEKIAEKLEALRAEVAKKKADQERLRELERNQDTRVFSAGRALMMGALSIVTLLTASSYFFLTGNFVIRTRHGAFWSGFVIFVISLLVAYYYRVTLMNTSANRKLTAFYLLGFAALLTNRSLGFFMPISVEASFTIDIIVLAWGFGMAGITVDKRLTFAAFPSFVALPLALIWPKWAYSFMVTAAIFAGAIAGVVWTKFAKFIIRDER